METKTVVQVRFDSQMQFEIGRTLDIGEPFCLNVESIVTGRTFLASITRWGKCLDGNSLISVPNGDLISIRDFVEYARSEVCTKHESDLISGKAKSHFKEQKQIAFLRIEPRHGPWIECSVDHHFLTKDEWKKASELSKKDKILLAPNEGKFGKLVLPDHEIKLLAYLIAEGSLSKGTGFTNTNEVIQKDFQDALREFNPTLLVKPSGATVWLSSGKKQGSAYRNKLLQWLIYNELYPSKSRTKSIPHNVLQLKEECLALFLNRLFAGDGSCSIYSRKLRHVKNPTVKIEYCTTSPILAMQIPLLLMRFGIFTSVYRIELPKRPYWRLQIAQVDSIKNFLKKIGIFGKDTRLAFDYVSGKFPTNALERDGAFVWDSIRRISSIATPATVFDLSIQTTNNYVANGLIVHNSWTDRKIIENCFGHAGIIIVDPEGEYSSLREKFAFLIIGKDIPLQLETAEFMAEEILKAKMSVIIDLSMVEDDEYGKEYVNTFLRRFFFLETSLRQPYLVVVEEAEDFCGERGIGTETCLHTLINIVKKGGKRGIGAIFIAHRPAWVSKGILSQCSNKAVGKVESTDFKALENYARIPSDVIAKLPDLGPGEFCFTGDWVKGRTFVKVGQVETTHLGYTPKVIPPSPQELRGVIAALQKALPQIIEKVKPTVVPIEQIRAELETKYRARLEAVQRTADEKAERKFKVEMDNLRSLNNKLSRSQALQPTAPITDALEHPIVRTRMTELNDKARDLLVKVEREQGLTRQQLAAFLTTSTDSVANLIASINKLFHAEVIVGDGKPIRYRSMLKRLFLTDVAKREIEELQRLQTLKEELTRKLAEANGMIEQLRLKLTEFQGKTTETENLRVSLSKANQKLSELNADIQRLLEEKKQLMIVGKAGESLAAFIETIVDRRLSGFTPNNSPSSFDFQKIQDLIDARVKEEIQKIPHIANAPEVTLEGSPVGLQHVKKVISIEEARLIVPTIRTDTVKGKILALAQNSFFDAWQSVGDINAKLVEDFRFNTSDQSINGALKELVDEQILGMKHTDRNRWKLGSDVVFEDKKEAPR